MKVLVCIDDTDNAYYKETIIRRKLKMSLNSVQIKINLILNENEKNSVLREENLHRLEK